MVSLHRDGGPAIIYKSGTQEWWRDGFCHRDGDLPAIYDGDGGRAWFKNGLCHRDNDKPAVIRFGLTEWRQNGKRHRENGPAVASLHGDKAWFINDIQVDPTTKEPLEELKNKKIVTI